MVPATVVGEVGYLLEQPVGPRIEAAFLQAITDGDFEPVPLIAEDFARMARLVAQYATVRCAGGRSSLAPRGSSG